MRGMMVGLLALVVTVASKCATVGTKLAHYLARQDARRWFASDGIPCIPVKVVAKRRPSFWLAVLGGAERAFCVNFWFRSSRDKFSALRSDTCFWRAQRAETIALRATVSSSRAFWESFEATLCRLKASVRSAASYCKEMRRQSGSKSCWKTG